MKQRFPRRQLCNCSSQFSIQKKLKSHQFFSINQTKESYVLKGFPGMTAANKDELIKIRNSDLNH